jgi:hypothetical protein
MDTCKTMQWKLLFDKIHVYIYIYIERERERERESPNASHFKVFKHFGQKTT